MNIAFILKIVSYVFFKLPLIVSIILICMFGIEVVKGEDFQLNKLLAGGMGILLVIIVPIIFEFFPQVSFIDKIGVGVFKIIFTLLILFTISDTYERKTNGIKGLGGISLIIILFNMIQRIAN